MSHPAYPDSHLKRMRAGKPIVFDCIEAAAPAALELDVWYEQTHLPRVRGRGLRRYAAPAHAAYFYIQELEGDGPVTAPAPMGQAGVHHHIHCRGLSLGGAHRLDSGLQALEAPYAYPIFSAYLSPGRLISINGMTASTSPCCSNVHNGSCAGVSSLRTPAAAHGHTWPCTTYRI